MAIEKPRCAIDTGSDQFKAYQYAHLIRAHGMECMVHYMGGVEGGWGAYVDEPKLAAAKAVLKEFGGTS